MAKINNEPQLPIRPYKADKRCDAMLISLVGSAALLNMFVDVPHLFRYFLMSSVIVLALVRLMMTLVRLIMNYVMQTRYRTHLLDDSHFLEWLKMQEK